MEMAQHEVPTRRCGPRLTRKKSLVVVERFYLEKKTHYNPARRTKMFE